MTPPQPSELSEREKLLTALRSGLEANPSGPMVKICFYIEDLVDFILAREQAARVRGRSSALRRLVNLELPSDEEWSAEYQAGVQQGFKMYESKLKFEIQRLNKLYHLTPNPLPKPKESK